MLWFGPDQVEVIARRKHHPRQEEVATREWVRVRVTAGSLAGVEGLLRSADPSGER